MVDSDLSRRQFAVGTGAVLGGLGSVSGSVSATTSQSEDDDRTALGACSFNVRYDNPDDAYPWSERLSRVANGVKQLCPDLLGVQEALSNQYDDLASTLDSYDWYGVGRDDGDREGEFVPIAWRTERFETVETGEFWLSETPTEPSVGWDADLPRVTTWARLHDGNTDTEIWFCNTHFSHIGQQARVNSARLIRERAATEASNGAVPVVTGDFNVTPLSNPYHMLIGRTGAGESPLVDGRREAGTTTVYGPWGTYHGFTETIEDRIDYVFPPQSASVHRYRTLGIREGSYRSDHLPVFALFEV